MTKKKPTIAISGCLIGEEIRFDGQHKRHPHVHQELRAYFNYQTFCPEVEMGLGIPRRTIKIVEKNEKMHLVDSKDSSIDHTKNAYQTFKTMIQSIKDVDGIVLTKGSPSCGYDKIKYYHKDTGHPQGKTRGLWAQCLEDNFPFIPKIDSGRLYDDHLRDSFRTQVLTHYQLHNLKKEAKYLIKFHETNKFYYLQYGANHLKKLGQICAGTSKNNFDETFKEYYEYLFGVVLNVRITNKKRTNVAEHIAGYFKKDMSKGDKKYLHDNIKAYHSSKLSFESLMVLIGFLVENYKEKYLQDQTIFKLYKKV